MAQQTRRGLFLPVLLITIGTGWLLTEHEIVPGVNWVWVLALGITGIVTLALGVDKVTFFAGLFLIAGSAASFLRQTGRITIETEVPALTVTAGVLLLIARFAPLPNPKWIDESPSE